MLINYLMIIPALLFALLIPCGLLCVLEYVLARLESPWPGRVLPILSALSSVSMSLMIAVNIAAVAGWQRPLLMSFAVLLVMNIPTVLFLVVYRVTRKRYIEKKSMDKMNIQDLE